MTDGPFRNADLPSRWKRYGDDLVSEVIGLEERVARVCHNMLSDVDVKSFKALWDNLSSKAQETQLDLDLVNSIDHIFENHSSSPQISIFQKHVVTTLRGGAVVQEALDRGLRGAAEEWRAIDKDRFDQHCVEARQRGDMRDHEFHKGIERNRETFGAINLNEFCRALSEGNKNAFRPALLKKKGIDEGPE